MNRCDYCLYKNFWDCKYGWDRLDNSKICKDFVLEFEDLFDKQKKKIQKILMQQN